MKIRTILVDDEKDSTEVLTFLLERYQELITIVGIAHRVEEAYQMIIEQRPDLVFLDIIMPKSDGFQLLQRFSKVDFEVIFTTSYNEYAINAIRFNALDYLLKPIDLDELEKALTKCKERLALKTSTAEQIKNLMHYLEQTSGKKKLSVHKNDKVIMIDTDTILHVIAQGRYSEITTDDGEVYILAKNLKDIENYLAVQSHFVRINKSVLINTYHIISYSKTLPYFVELRNQAVFEIPRRKKSEILERIKTHLR